MNGRHTALATPLVGRASELARLEEALNAAQAGHGQVVILAGEAGIGKSRLMAEVRRRAAVLGFVIIQGTCFEQDEHLPYAVWIDGLRALLAGHNAAEIHTLLGEQAQIFARLLPELRTEGAADVSAEPAVAQRQLFEALARLLARVAGAQPLLLALEDLHWSDASSLDLLQFCARHVPGQRILLLATYRTEDVTPPLGHLLTELDRQRLGQEMGLAPLTTDEAAALIASILAGRQSIQTDTLDAIIRLTEGNPFYIEEALKSLIDTVATAADGAPTGGQFPIELPIPRSVQETVARRAAQLSKRARRLLTVAAVVGQRSDFALLQLVTGATENALLAGARELVNAQLLGEVSADTLMFRHALTRVAVYAGLLARERRTLHRQVLAAAEQLYQDSTDAHIAELAYQAFAAEDWTRAINYAIRAGEQAAGLFATRESLGQYSRALEAAERLGISPPPGVLRARGQARETLGEFDAARADYERLLGAALAANDGLTEWQALLDLGFLWSARDYATSGEYLRQALTLARRLEDPVAMAKSLNRLGNWHFNRMQVSTALDSHREALAIFRGLDDRVGVAETLDLVGSLQLVRGDMLSGRACFDEAISLFRTLGAQRRLAQCLVMLPLSYRFNTEILGRFDAAGPLAAAQEGLKAAREMGWRSGELQAHGRMTQCMSETGDYTEAFRHGEVGFAIAEEIGHTGFLGAAHWGLSQLYLDLFAFDRALPHIEPAARLAAASGSAIFQHHARMAAAQYHLAQGRWREAEAALGPQPALPAGWLPTAEREHWSVRAEIQVAKHEAAVALEIVDRLIAATINVEQYGPRAVPRLSLLRGQALTALRRIDEAEAELQAAWDMARAQGKRPMQWRIALALARAARANGRRTEAAQWFAAAAEIVQELAAGLDDEALRDGYLRHTQALLPRPRPASPGRASRQAFDGLSEREREVAALITGGLSNRQIAETLIIAERTVDRHVANIMTKLGYNARTQIAAWAVEKGLHKAP